jgi:acyl-coenzyme A thioesterase PaaI-like protein
MGSFDQATAVRRTGEGRYTAELDAEYGFEQALNGGYLMAVLARAALDASGRPHPISTAVSFMKVARPGPADVHVDSRRSGRTAHVSRVTLVQNDEAIVEALITTGALDGAARPLYSAEAGELPPLADCVTFGEKEEEGFAAQVELMYDKTAMGWLDGRPSGRPEMRAYFRLRDEAYVPDGVLLALAVDSLPPVVLNTGAYGWSPTVELTWHMRAVPAAGRLALHGHGRLVSDGWFDEEVEVWDSAGRLVAQSRQLARAGRHRR